MKPGQGFAKKVTLKNIKDFESLLSHATERAKAKSKKKSKKQKSAESIFKGKSIKIKVPFKTIGKKKRSSVSKKKAIKKEVRPSLLTTKTLLWAKKLSSTDAQNPPDPSGHPTGCIKLTQSKFKVNNEYIDHKTYFRDVVFRGLNWKTVKTTPFTETADVDVVLIIDGKDHGTHKLSLRHKPSGVAGQGNAATQLHWTSMENIIRKINPKGKTLKLFSTVESENHFIIMIE